MARRGHGEGTVYFNAKRNHWEARKRMPDGTRRIWYCKTQREALRKLSAVNGEFAAGRPIPEGRETVAQFLTRWVADLQSNQAVRPTTLKRYRGDVAHHIIPALGRIRVQDLAAAQVQRFVTALHQEEGLKPASVRRSPRQSGRISSGPTWRSACGFRR